MIFQCSEEDDNFVETLKTLMTHKRLNHVKVCHVHNNKLAKLDTVKLAEQFISRSPIAGKRVFGSFCDI